jgi:hypothetical protein
MRHVSSRFTLDGCSQARKGAKRQAQQPVVQMILPQSPTTRIAKAGSDHWRTIAIALTTLF